ncbi:Uncharacterised protein [Mycobacteroides abscessus subsp. massiliense]|nr:Uncharacterised protein [Mycobacteroides abscessus subsp. massiliense]
MQRGIQVGLDEFDVAQQLTDALQRVVLTLDRDQHLVRRHECVDRQQAERGRAVDEYEVKRVGG